MGGGLIGHYPGFNRSATDILRLAGLFGLSLPSPGQTEKTGDC
jgi:hypothetical protein